MSAAIVWLMTAVVGAVFAAAFCVLGSYVLAGAYVLVAIFAIYRFANEPF